MENASLKPSSWLRGTPMNRTEVHLYTSEFEAKDLLGQAPPPIPGGVVSPGFAPTPDPTTLDLIHDTTGTGRDIHLLQNDKYMQVPIPIRIRYGASVFFFSCFAFWKISPSGMPAWSEVVELVPPLLPQEMGRNRARLVNNKKNRASCSSDT